MRIRRPHNPLRLPRSKYRVGSGLGSLLHPAALASLEGLAAGGWRIIRRPRPRLAALVIGAAFLSLGLFLVTQNPVGSLPRENTKLAEPPAELPEVAALPAIQAPLLPQAPQIPKIQTEDLSVGRGDTLMGLLLGAGIERRVAHSAIKSLSAHYDPRRLSARHEVSLIFESNGTQSKGTEDTARRFMGLKLRPDLRHEVNVRRTGERRFQSSKAKRPLMRRMLWASGMIRSSLYVAAAKKKVPVSVLMELIRIYSWDVDYQREIRPGDGFEIMYENLHDLDGALVSAGEILYAKLVLRGTHNPLYRHKEKDGSVGYFDAKGHSAQKPLMRTPIDGARLSSGYGRRRHPTLGYNKMHRGVDFAAPRGTPIYAAGKGSIVYRGRNGAYGKYIRIRHNSDYATAYAHLRSFKRGVGKGARVRQGQVIGYVGSTGRSTGPHLHYEILRQGRRVNPMRIRLPSGRKLKGGELARFQDGRKETDAIFAALTEPSTIAQGGK